MYARIEVEIEAQGAVRCVGVPGPELVIGRDETCTISLASPEVAPQLYRLFRRGGALWREDLSGQAQGAARLLPGEVLRCGAVRVRAALVLEDEPLPPPAVREEAGRAAGSALAALAEREPLSWVQLAARPDAEIPLLLWLAERGGAGTLRALALHPRAPRALLETVADRFPRQVLENPGLPALLAEPGAEALLAQLGAAIPLDLSLQPSQLEQLANHSSEAVRLGVLAHPAATEEVIEAVPYAGAPAVLRALLQHPRLRQSWLERICTQGSPEDRRIIAATPGAAAVVFSWLVKDPDPRVRAAVARRPDLPAALRASFGNDLDAVVRQSILVTALRDGDAALLERFALDREPVLRAQLALHPACPPGARRALRDDPNLLVRAIVEDVQEAPATPPANSPRGRPGVVIEVQRVAPEPGPVRSYAKEEVFVGRVPENDFILTHGSVSKRHLRLFVQDGALYAEDLRSANGTQHNQAPVERPVRIAPGDVISAGLYALKARLVEASPVEATGVIVLPEARETVARTAPMPSLVLPRPSIQAPEAPRPLRAGSRLTVRVASLEGPPTTHTFSQDLLTVGRVEGNDLVLAHGKVSKLHCRLFAIDDKLYIEDARSTNGTLVNQQSIKQPTLLEPGDVVFVGTCLLRALLVLP